MLTERKLRLEANIVNLRKEHLEISSAIEKLTLTDDQILEIQEFCDGIRDRVDTASFDEKRQLLELFDVRGKLAIENNEKVIHATCLLQLQPVSLALTSHSLCCHNGTPYMVTVRLVLPNYGRRIGPKRKRTVP